MGAAFLSRTAWMVAPNGGYTVLYLLQGRTMGVPLMCASHAISGGVDTNSQRLASEGYVVVPDVLSDAQCDLISGYLDVFQAGGAGSRTLLGQPWCRELAGELQLQASVLPADAVAVQCTLFDKTPEKNWLVTIHQDLSVPVDCRVDSPNCSGWSEKERSVYVQPPAHLLDTIVAVRVHIDPCPPESGALRVVPGSHQFGRLDSAHADRLRNESGEVVVPVSRGGALVMRPLLLHGSSKAKLPSPRRVLHYLFGPAVLPYGLAWPAHAGSR